MARYTSNQINERLQEVYRQSIDSINIIEKI